MVASLWRWNSVPGDGQSRRLSRHPNGCSCSTWMLAPPRFRRTPTRRQSFYCGRDARTRRRFETASAVGVEGNRSAGGVQPDQIDHRLEELQQRFWLTDAAADDDTVVLLPPQCLHDATLSRDVQLDEALIGDQVRVLKAR